MHIDELLKYTKEVGASDLHIKPMRPPLVRIKGKLLPIKADPLKPPDIEAMLKAILNQKQIDKLEETQAVDFGYGVPGVARFRGNIYFQRGTLSGTFRRIPYEIKLLDELNLPKVLHDLCGLPDGLVLVTGPTGMGKSTTLAAIIREVAEKDYLHIVTIEDPIEFLFSDKAASISQREVGTDTPAFKEALRNSLRQDPDVIMVGEMRDTETISTVITAAETGHLVFSTLHTNNSSQTIDRIIDAFPSGQHKQVRAQLAQVLRAIVSLRLIPKADNSGLTAAVEILRNTPRVAKLIEDGAIKDIPEEIEGSVAHFRMQSLNQSLVALIVNGAVTYAEAMAASQDSDDLSLKLRKLFPAVEEKARGGLMPSTADFAEIQELMGVKKAYEEQEEKYRLRLGEKDEQIAQLEDDLAALRRQMTDEGGTLQAARTETEKLRKEIEFMKKDRDEKLRVLQERIKELSSQMADSRSKTPAPPAEQKSGFFKR